jgi:signal transduction histidine kinase/CheY-like chemotaxis protein
VKKNKTSRHARLLEFMVPLSIISYGAFRITVAVSRMEFREAALTACLAAAALITVILSRAFGKIYTPAFAEPMILYISYLLAAVVMGSFTFFFDISLMICAIGALYLKSRKLLQYIACSGLITMGLVLFRIPAKISGQAIPFSESMLRWIILLFSSAFIYLVTKYASEKVHRSVNAGDHLTALLATMPNRVVLLDSLNRVTYLSNGFAEMVHLEDPQMAAGRPLVDLFHDMEVKDIFINILEQEGHYENITEIRLDGKQYYFRIISGKLYNKTGGSQINMIDITPEMTAKSEAENASASKSAFLATMSHEIRTPLNAIIGLSEIELQKKLPEDTYINLEKVYNSGSNLLGIINDILDISKIEAGNFEFVLEAYDVTSLINDAVQLNIVRIGTKQIEFEVYIDEMIPARLYGDELRIKQILNNLLSNAFKYTDRGRVTLEVKCEKEDKDVWLIFTISDTGHGIKKENMGKLFSQYTQLDARANRNIEGTGLGLSIAKNMAERMGGTISVESEYGKGSAFTVRLRQEIIDQTPIGKEAAENLRQYRFIKNKILSRIKNLIRSYMPYGKVLIVDDVETNLDVVKGLMLPYGLVIDCVSSGREAIEKIREISENSSAQKYDVVFMDHMMPEMDGIEAVRIIRNGIDGEYAKTVPIIALTANALSGNEDMFLSRGFNAYISKPIDIMQMDLALNTWVRNKQTEETLKKAEYEKNARARAETSAPSGIFDGLYAEGIDLEAGRERFNNDASYLKIIRSYCRHTPELLKKLHDFSAKNLHPYTVAVHGLKGSSYGICADEIGKYAEALEMAARAEDITTINEKNSGLIKKTEKLLAGLDEILQKFDQRGGEKIQAPAPDPAVLMKLLEACKQHKLILMEEALGELEQYAYEAGGDLVFWLREQLDNLEYCAMEERLEKLITTTEGAFFDEQKISTGH